MSHKKPMLNPIEEKIMHRRAEQFTDEEKAILAQHISHDILIEELKRRYEILVELAGKTIEAAVYYDIFR